MGFVFTPEMLGMTAVASCFGGWIFGNLYAATRKNLEEGILEDSQMEISVAEEQESLFALRLTPKIAPRVETNQRPAPQQERPAPEQDPIIAALEKRAEPAVPNTRTRSRTLAARREQNSAQRPARVQSPARYEASYGAYYGASNRPQIDTQSDAESNTQRGAQIDDFPLSEIRAHARHLLQTHNVWDAPETQDQIAEFMRDADRGSVKLLSEYRGSIEELQRANVHGIDPVPARHPFGDLAESMPRLADIGPVCPNRSLAELACLIEERNEANQPKVRFAGVAC